MYETDSRFEFRFSCDLQVHLYTVVQTGLDCCEARQTQSWRHKPSYNGVKSDPTRTQKEPTAFYRIWIDNGFICIDQVQTSIPKMLGKWDRSSFHWCYFYLNEA